MTSGGLDLLEGSFRHDAAAGPNEAKLKLAVHFNTQNWADELCWPVVIGAISFGGVVLERRIRGKHQLLNISQIAQMFPTFRSFSLVQQDL